MSPVELALLYRGDLSSCNYSCWYCPFAKRSESRASLARDQSQVRRFVEWASGSSKRLSILFTPWGEGLVRKHYREALVQLSLLSHIREVGIQTNLATAPHWLAAACTQRVSLWCTYHPSQTTRRLFLQRCAVLEELGVRYSVGMVALREDLAEVQAVRAILSPKVYLWLNAYDGRDANYYSAQQVAALTAVDPHFAYNLAPQPSLGARCRAGASALSVDGEGNVRPCHFLQRSLGNLYDGSYLAHLQPQPCSNARCDCYIGYALREDLPFQASLLRSQAPA